MMPQGSCKIERAYLGDSGEYWCETDGQERSNRVNITVTAGSVILESPILPVLEGNTVTLHCRHRTTIPNLQALFYKDDVLVQSIPAEGITIKNVTKSDEGLYKCSISNVGESPGSWLAVGETLPDDSDSPRVFSLLWIAVTILILALVLLLVGFLHVRKHRVVFCFSSKTPTAESQSGEDGQIVSGDGSDPDGVTYAVVVTKQRKNKASADAADNLSPETNHSRKPQRERDGDESSLQAVYSTLKTSETPQAPPLHV
uniref:Ig-like domain-containing protein n=1 Tax=Dicentrarchus labrax TaxID=13489 RepID=A0A8C4GHR4_DICLA